MNINKSAILATIIIPALTSAVDISLNAGAEMLVLELGKHDAAVSSSDDLHGGSPVTSATLTVPGIGVGSTIGFNDKFFLSVDGRLYSSTKQTLGEAQGAFITSEPANGFSVKAGYRLNALSIQAGIDSYKLELVQKLGGATTKTKDTYHMVPSFSVSYAKPIHGKFAALATIGYGMGDLKGAALSFPISDLPTRAFSAKVAISFTPGEEAVEALDYTADNEPQASRQEDVEEEASWFSKIFDF